MWDYCDGKIAKRSVRHTFTSCSKPDSKSQDAFAVNFEPNMCFIAGVSGVFEQLGFILMPVQPELKLMAQIWLILKGGKPTDLSFDATKLCACVKNLKVCSSVLVRTVVAESKCVATSKWLNPTFEAKFKEDYTSEPKEANSPAKFIWLGIAFGLISSMITFGCHRAAKK